MASRQADPGSNRLRSKYGPWAVVTGASDGIGRACAEQLAAAGVHLIIAARRREVLVGLAETLSERHGVEVKVVAGDLGTPLGVQALLQAAAGVDVGLLVAAAGFGTSGAFIARDLEQELAMIDVNCRAVTALAHAFARRFTSRGRGGIVLFSSLVAFQGVPRAASYAASKAFVQSLAEALAVELAPAGVDVLASAPGPVHTGFGGRAAMRMQFAQSAHDVAERTLAALGRTRTVRPGWLAKILEYSLRPLPRSGRVRMMGHIMAGMTGHHG